MPLITLTLTTPVAFSTTSPTPEPTTLLWASPTPTIAALITSTIITTPTPTPPATPHGWNTWTPAHRAGVILGGILGAVAVPVMLLCCGWRGKHPPRTPLPETPASSYTGGGGDKKRYLNGEGGITQHLPPPRVRGGDGSRGSSRGAGSIGLLSPRGGSRRGGSRDSRPSRREERRRERASVVLEEEEGVGSSGSSGVVLGKAKAVEMRVPGGLGVLMGKSPPVGEKAMGGFGVKVQGGLEKGGTPPLISPLLISPILTAEGSGSGRGEKGAEMPVMHAARQGSRASSAKRAGNPVLDRVKRGSRSEGGLGSDSGSVSGVVRL